MRIWLLLLLAVFFSYPAHADELRPGYIELTQLNAQDWRLIWKAPLKGGVTAQTQPVLPDNCRVLGQPVRDLAFMAVTTTTQLRCVGPIAGKVIGLSGLSTSQTDVLVRIASIGRPVQALRLTAAEPSIAIPAKPERWQVARTYFVTGVEHILFGYDHLLFVIALVLLLSGFWTIAKAVTAFTIAHSLTLIGTTLGLFGLPQQPVEALIALSIIFLAVEIIKKRPDELRLSQRLPWLVSFLFGLLHGFGFAGALREIGLPETDVPTALLTFNLGVEFGQLAIVGASLLAIMALRRLPTPAYAMALKSATYAIGITASFWFIERILT
jgi:hydrogenase/urease accessory protein HupE